MTKKPSQVVLGLVNGIEVLHYLATSQEPVSGLAMAKELNLCPIHVNRLLNTLVWMGVAYRNKSRKYGLGPGMHVLAAESLAASNILRHIATHITPLLEYPHCVGVGVLWRDRVTFIYHKNVASSLRETVRQWVAEATVSSVGMALLSHRTDEEILSFYGDRDDIPGLYPTTDELMQAIIEIRESEHAVLRWTTHTSLAVTVGNPPYIGLAMSGFKTLKEERFFLKLLREVADNITHSDLLLDNDIESLALGVSSASTPLGLPAELLSVL